MATLTDEQLRFLKAQKISLSLVFDASGLAKSERIREMDALGKKFYYGDAACQKAGHTIRTKAGHCAQCDTAKIAYQLRSSDPGFLYVTHSKKHGYVKVGFTKYHPQDRGAVLRNEGYGGIRDWDVKSIVEVTKDAGRLEFAVHSALEKYRKPLSYEKMRGVIVECREIFECPLEVALKVFDSVITRSII